jgi:gamma-tubulin complex component 3
MSYGGVGALARSIDAAHRAASQHLFDVLLDKFRLLDHLAALKNYLLLGHGDFIDQLMDALGCVRARAAPRRPPNIHPAARASRAPRTRSRGTASQQP